VVSAGSIHDLNVILKGPSSSSYSSSPPPLPSSFSSFLLLLQSALQSLVGFGLPILIGTHDTYSHIS
jgi:hypothetical protein